MTDLISLDSASPRFALPLLFAGQAQKEVFVNEALSMIDGLLHCAVEEIVAVPPLVPDEGSAWLIAEDSTGDWADRGGQIALRQTSQWLFAAPRDGMRVLNKETGQDLRRTNGAWVAATAPAPLTGGAVVDTEARAMLAALVASLRQAGIFAT